MWRLWIFLGSTIWLITIAGSATMNFLAGQSLGRTAVEGFVLAFIGLAADGWKAVGPIFIATLFRARRLISSFVCMLVWFVTVVFAISAAIGFVAQNRQTVVSGRAHLHSTFASVTNQIAQVEAQRERLGTIASVHEIEASISAKLAQPIERGTVGTISSDCTIDTRRTRNECSDIAILKQELARSTQAVQLDARLSLLRTELGTLIERGAVPDDDAQSTVISDLTRGWLSRQNVGASLIVVLVVMIELISAFAPVIVSEYATITSKATENNRARDADDKIEAIREFLFEQTEPSDHGAVSRFEMFLNFTSWCRASGRAVIEPAQFAKKLEEICREDFSDQVALRGEHYTGLQLVRRGS